MGRIAMQEERLTEQGQIPVCNEEDDDYCHFVGFLLFII